MKSGDIIMAKAQVIIFKFSSYLTNLLGYSVSCGCILLKFYFIPLKGNPLILFVMYHLFSEYFFLPITAQLKQNIVTLVLVWMKYWFIYNANVFCPFPSLFNHRFVVPYRLPVMCQDFRSLLITVGCEVKGKKHSPFFSVSTLQPFKALCEQGRLYFRISNESNYFVLCHLAFKALEALCHCALRKLTQQHHNNKVYL